MSELASSSASTVLALIELLGASTPSPSATPVDESKVEAGVIGLAFFVVMGGVLVALVFSMRRHLGRVDVTRHATERARRVRSSSDLGAEKGAAPPPEGV